MLNFALRSRFKHFADAFSTRTKFIFYYRNFIIAIEKKGSVTIKKKLVCGSLWSTINYRDFFFVKLFTCTITKTVLQKKSSEKLFFSEINLFSDLKRIETLFSFSSFVWRRRKTCYDLNVNFSFILIMQAEWKEKTCLSH